jgi:hypothetical protein
MNELNNRICTILNYQYYKKKLFAQIKNYCRKKYDLFFIRGSISKYRIIKSSSFSSVLPNNLSLSISFIPFSIPHKVRTLFFPAKLTTVILYRGCLASIDFFSVSSILKAHDSNGTQAKYDI